jgi:hypothetical protein
MISHWGKSFAKRTDLGKTGGYENIYRDLLDELKSVDLGQAAKALDIAYNSAGQVEVVLMGTTYLIESSGIHRPDGQTVATARGSVLVGYLLQQGRGEPAGKFVSFDDITGMVPARSSYSSTSLEGRLAKYGQMDPTRFHDAIVLSGGRSGGEVGIGGKSWIIQLLPKIPVQLVFYRGDEEFPAAARLLIDQAAVNFLEFEFLAVLATIFVEQLIAEMSMV